MRRCPVCHRTVQATSRLRTIAAHTDKARNACEGSGLPFDTAERVPEHKPRPKPACHWYINPRSRKETLKNFTAANKRRTSEGANRRVRQAHLAIRTLETHGGTTSFHNTSLGALYARIRYPDHTLAEIAEVLGVTKHTYSARLRRAIQYAERIEAREQQRRASA